MSRGTQRCRSASKTIFFFFSSQHLPRITAGFAYIRLCWLATPLGSGERSDTAILLRHFVLSSVALISAGTSSNSLLFHSAISTLTLFLIWFPQLPLPLLDVFMAFVTSHNANKPAQTFFGQLVFDCDNCYNVSDCLIYDAFETPYDTIRDISAIGTH